MRVCVYEGWKNLIAGVQRARAKEVRAWNEGAASRKRKAAEKEWAGMRSKYTKSNTGTARSSRTATAMGEDTVKDEPVDELQSLLEVTQKEFVRFIRAHDVVITTYPEGELAIQHVGIGKG